ncbi:ArsR/SmtB family transcription factor [Candidatus Bipolaricaulota bacterium]
MDSATQRHDQIAQMSQTLRILSVETRLRMLLLLRDRNLCVGALACRLGLTQGAVSQHLKVLRDAGFVTAEREGYYVHYRVDENELARWSVGISRLFERLRTGAADETEAGVAMPTQCSKRKEEPCARRERKASARRASR